MPKVEKLLLSCSKPRSSAHTTRKLISFKRRSHYLKCIQQLANFGIKPIKSISRGYLIVCHVDSRQSDKIGMLARHPSIKYVEPDFKVHAHGFIPGATRSGFRGDGLRMNSRQSTTVPYMVKRKLRPKTAAPSASKAATNTGMPWNIVQVQAPKVWPATRGSRAAIGIIDTGIAKHPDLSISGGVNIMGGSSYADDNGHGTHVAGIAAALGSNGMQPGVAPRAKLYAVKALDANGSGYVSDLIKGIEWCRQRKIPVINMSLGLEGPTSTALKEAVQHARRKGITIVASAGNSGPSNTGGIDQPARYADVIAVAASTRAGKIADYSSRGSGIAVTAPGSYIKSTWPGGGYMMLSGTSMSSPHIAGGAALLKSLKPSLSPAAIKKRLRAAARKLPGYGSGTQGSGLVQLFGSATLVGSSSVLQRRTRNASKKN